MKPPSGLMPVFGAKAPSAKTTVKPTAVQPDQFHVPVYKGMRPLASSDGRWHGMRCAIAKTTQPMPPNAYLINSSVIEDRIKDAVTDAKVMHKQAYTLPVVYKNQEEDAVVHTMLAVYKGDGIAVFVDNNFGPPPQVVYGKSLAVTDSPEAGKVRLMAACFIPSFDGTGREHEMVLEDKAKHLEALFYMFAAKNSLTYDSPSKDTIINGLASVWSPEDLSSAVASFREGKVPNNFNDIVNELRRGDYGD